jgi:hypothetical protein
MDWPEGRKSLSLTGDGGTAAGRTTRRFAMKIRNLMLGAIALIVLVGSCVPANAQYHHRRHRRHHHHAVVVVRH